MNSCIRLSCSNTEDAQAIMIKRCSGSLQSKYTKSHFDYAATKVNCFRGHQNIYSTKYLFVIKYSWQLVSSGSLTSIQMYVVHVLVNTILGQITVLSRLCGTRSISVSIVPLTLLYIQVVHKDHDMNDCRLRELWLWLLHSMHIAVPCNSSSGTTWRTAAAATCTEQTK